MRCNIRKIVLSQVVFRGFLALAMASVAGQGCTRKMKGDFTAPPTKNEAPGIVAPAGPSPTQVISAGSGPSSNSASGQLAYLGGIVSTRVIAGQVFIPVEGTFSDASFTAVMEASTAQSFSDGERNALITQEMSSVLKAIGSQMRVMHAKITPEVGFFTAFIPLEGYERLAAVTGLSRRVLVNPVISMLRDPESLGLKPATQAVALGLHSDPQDGRADHAAYSGLGRIGVTEFLAAVKADTGEDADGSTATIGVTDTGVTLNHPAFVDAAGQPRIQYLKDFTNEGLIYFAANARFEASVPLTVPAGVDINEALSVTAQYLQAPVGTQVPKGDRFSDVADQLFLLSPELRAALLTPNSGARLGVFSEASLGTPDGSETVDLNHNGTTSDLLWAILVPDADPTKSKMYFDKTGRGDFRENLVVTSFNGSKSTVKLFSETVGFEIKPFPLEDSAGNPVDATAAAIVGYDPGNHGSHVSGIIAARKTISNASDGTQARGVAPNGKLMVNRVCANNGGCQATGAIIDLSLNGAEVINMSLGGLGAMNDGYGVQETVINRLTLLKNTLFVISAGNSGPGRQTVGSPSVARMALSVAATASKKMIQRQYQWEGSGKNPSANPADDDFMLFFSSRGPTAAGGLKPNISAPGTELSSIQLNAAPGARPGLDVFWGTSMAAPTATGAVALLIDGVKRYNAAHPDKALSLDARILHKVISASARGFDVDSFDVTSQARTHGQYSWIDQGNGMINLLGAWEGLKAERDTKIPTAVYIASATGNQSVDLDYEVRVLRKSPNGLDYTGAVDAPTDAQGGKEPKFGRGIYLDLNSTESLIEVQVARRLPSNLLRRADLGDLMRLLNTSADDFAIETVVFGSSVEWLKAGSLDQLDCQSSPTAGLTILGPGPVDDFEAIGPRSIGIRASNLQVCLSRQLMAALPPGDHGALIKAYRVADGRREAAAAFTVPVYVAVPHKTLAGHAGYRISGNAPSFSVNRNYVQIPEGTSMVKVSIEVPAATVTGNDVKGCAGVELMVLEGENTAIPAELKPRAKARALNCEKNGVVAAASKRVVTYSRMNPKAGLWDIHVFGSYSFRNSPYTLTVEFAKVATSIAAIAGEPSVLNGSLGFEVLDSSLTISPSAQRSEFGLNALVQEQSQAIAQDQNLIVANLDGVKGRSFDASVALANFSTGGAPGSDIDLAVLECTDAANIPDSCSTIGQSAGATDVESVDFVPLPGKFYAALAVGYDIPGGTLPFQFVETRKFAADEPGSLTVTPDGADKFKVDFLFDIAASSLLRSPLFTGGKYFATGDLIIKGQDGASLVRLPVKVNAPAP